MSNNLSGGTIKLPNKSFNTYVTTNDGGKNNLTSGLNLMSSRLGANAASINATNRLSNGHGGIITSSSSILNNHSNNTTAGSMRATLKQPRNSFAFAMRTNLDQEL